MTEPPLNPIRATDAEARRLARALIAAARFGALGVIDPESGAPMVSRIAMATTARGAPMSLVSDLSDHTTALRAAPLCSLLLGEPGPKGDPLTHPRITLQCTARFMRHGAPDHATLRHRYLSQHPKAQLYIDFADFSFVLFEVRAARLIGGFGKAYRPTPQDLDL